MMLTSTTSGSRAARKARALQVRDQTCLIRADLAEVRACTKSGTKTRVWKAAFNTPQPISSLRDAATAAIAVTDESTSLDLDGSWMFLVCTRGPRPCVRATHRVGADKVSVRAEIGDTGLRDAMFAAAASVLSDRIGSPHPWHTATLASAS